MTELENEGKIFGRYLLSDYPDNHSLELYCLANDKLKLFLTEKEKRAVQYMCNHQWSVGYIDSYLAFSDKYGAIRRKIHLFFSIIESSPEYSSKFETKKTNFLYPIVLLFILVLSLLRALFGALLYKLI